MWWDHTVVGRERRGDQEGAGGQNGERQKKGHSSKISGKPDRGGEGRNSGGLWVVWLGGGKKKEKKMQMTRETSNGSGGLKKRLTSVQSC